MQVRAMLIAACLMAITDVGSAMASDSPAPSANSSVTRRRAVDPPRPPSHILLDVSADDDLRYTNHNLHPTPIKTCIERTTLCVIDTLAPGASTTRARLVRTLGQDHGDLEIYATGNVEIRGHFDALPLTLATSDRQTIPVMSSGQTFATFLTSPGTITYLHLLGNGAEIERKTLNAPAGISTGAPFSVFAGEQLDTITSVPGINTAYVDGVQYRGKPVSEAIGTQYLVGADPTTVGVAKNIDPTAVLSFQTIARAADGTSLVKHYSAVNWGTRAFQEIATSRSNVEINGTFITPGRYSPMLLWGTAVPQTQGATARNAFGVGTDLKNASLNQIPATVALYSTANDATYTISGYDDAGTKVDTLAGSIPASVPRSIDLSRLITKGVTRIELEAEDATNGYSNPQNILIGATVNGVEKAGFRVEKPAPRVTGERYVAKWLDRVRFQYFYFDYEATRCLLRSDCSLSKDYALALATLFHEGSQQFSVADIMAGFELLTNGVLARTSGNGDPEMYRGFPPSNFTFSEWRGQNAMRIYMFPDGRSSSDLVAPSDSPSYYGLLRSFMVEWVDRHPQRFGGTTETGPSLDFDPKWNGTELSVHEQYLRRWFDPAAIADLWLNAKEARCFLSGTCGTTSYAWLLANNFVLSADTQMTRDQIDAWLRSLVDGVESESNLELDFRRDPFHWNAASRTWTLYVSDGTNSRYISFGHFTSGQGENITRYVRECMYQLLETSPQEYGGAANPVLPFDPSWDREQKY